MRNARYLIDISKSKTYDLHNDKDFPFVDCPFYEKLNNCIRNDKCPNTAACALILDSNIVEYSLLLFLCKIIEIYDMWAIVCMCFVCMGVLQTQLLSNKNDKNYSAICKDKGFANIHKENFIHFMLYHLMSKNTRTFLNNKLRKK